MFYLLQLYRGIAAFFVLFFHLAGTLALEKYYGKPAEILSSIFLFGGDVGVTFFFVLSGFIIHYNHKKDLSHPNMLFRYYWKRAIRIYVPYITIFIVVYFFYHLIDFSGKENALDFKTFLKSLFLLPQDPNIVGGSGAPIIIVAWSLQFELFFYFIYGFGILRKTILYFFILLYLYLFSYQIISQSFTFPLTFFSSSCPMLFLFGIIIAELFNRLKFAKNNNKNINLYVSILLYALAIAYFAGIRRTLSISFLRIFFGLLASYLILASVIYENSKKTTNNNKRIFSNLGDISYPLYLIHFPLISVLTKIFSHFIILKNILFIVAIFIIEVVLTYVISLIFNRVYEKPLLKKLSLGQILAKTKI